MHFVIDDRITKFKKSLEYGERELHEVVKLNTNKTDPYIDLSVDDKLKVLRNLKGIAEKKGVKA